MNEYPNIMKEKLTSIVAKMAASSLLFVKNPGKDFTRNRKLPFESVIQLLLSMGGNSIYKELLEAQGYNINTATTFAFIQQQTKSFRPPWNFCFMNLRGLLRIQRSIEDSRN